MIEQMALQNYQPSQATWSEALVAPFDEIDPFLTAHADKEFMCVDCMKCFKLKSSLKRHRFLIHDDYPVVISREIFQDDTHKDKLFECRTCAKKFSRKYDLERHILHTGCRGNKRPSYVCQACKRVFCRKDNLQEHKKICCDKFVKKKKYKCRICNKELQTKTLVKIHLRTHPETNKVSTLH